MLWIVGLIMIVVGVFALFRRSLLMGIVLIIIGVVLGGLNVLSIRPPDPWRPATSSTAGGLHFWASVAMCSI